MADLAPMQINGKPWECAKCGHAILTDLVWGETAGAFHAACRWGPPYVVTVTPVVAIAKEDQRGEGRR